MNTFQIKKIEAIPVAYIGKSGHPASVAGQAFMELEQTVPLQGNHFYGIYDESANEYRACVAINDSNRQIVQELSQGIIQGGSYAYTTLTGDYNMIVREIGPTFDALAAQYTRDTTRPCVEFYKRHTEVLVMLPIQESTL
jgi:DNA gyrase inhibitor GyrI